MHLLVWIRTQRLESSSFCSIMRRISIGPEMRLGSSRWEVDAEGGIGLKRKTKIFSETSGPSDEGQSLQGTGESYDRIGSL